MGRPSGRAGFGADDDTTAAELIHRGFATLRPREQLRATAAVGSRR